MCGIVGLAAFGNLGKKEERIRQEAMIYLGTELLRVTEDRGKDATGVAALRTDGDYMGLKMGVAASEFVSRFGGKETDYAGFTELWRKGTKPVKIMIGHCRNSSVGNSTDNVNNHPIKVGEVVGIHNGTLKNHNIIIEKLGNKRDGVVDSEAIFRLMNHFTNKGTEPFTPEVILEVTKRLEGQYACLAFNGNNPYQLASFRDGRPTEYAYIRPLQLLIVASDKKYFDTTFCNFNREVNLYGNKKNFPHLNLEDVDFRILPNDHLAIFDLTTDITDTTKLSDLFETTKIPFNDKIWTIALTNRDKAAATRQANKAASTSKGMGTGTGTGNTVQTNLNTSDKTTTIKPAGKQKKVDKERPIGRAWVKELRKYRIVDQTEVEKTKSVGRVELDTEETSAVVVKSKPKGLQEEANIEDTIVNTATIEEIEYKNDSSDGKTQTKEIDMSVDSEAMEMASESLSTMPRYDDDNDLITDLGVASVEVLKSMNLHALANRIRKIGYRIGFESGVKAIKRKVGVSGDNNHIVKTQRNMRVLKTMSALFSRIINRKMSPTSAEFHEEIDLAVQDTLSKQGSELNSKTFRGLFSAGDMRDDSALRQVQRMLKDKENR